MKPTDERYTPAWIFDAAGLIFDIDVAAPADPAFRTCPARRYLTAADDGLSVPWSGLVWLNPPYSAPAPWVAKFAAHEGGGMALMPGYSDSPWTPALLRAADALALLSVKFTTPDRRAVRAGPAIMLLAGSGPAAAAAVTRVARAQPRGITPAWWQAA